MKKILCLTGFCFIISMASYAQSADEKQLTAAVETFRKLLIDPDKKGLEAITATDLSYGHSNGRIEDKATFVESLVSKTFDFVTIDLTQHSIKILGNTAIVRHNLSGDTNDGGKPGHANIGIMQIWQKQQGKWKLLARQAFKLLPPA